MIGAQSPDEPNGEAFFLSQLEVIERVISFVSARHHLPGVDADDFSSHVKLKLIEDDYGILRKFQGRSSVRTYLTVVIQRMFLDYRISAWGKWRPSAEAKRLGPIAVLLEQLIGRDNYTFDEACELLETHHQVTLSRAELEAIAGRLPIRLRRRFESEDALAQVRTSEPSPDELMAEREQVETQARVTAAVAAALAALEPQDRLIVKLRFEDGHSVVDIARLLRLDQKALYRRLDHLLKGLRARLLEEGIDFPWS